MRSGIRSTEARRPKRSKRELAAEYAAQLLEETGDREYAERRARQLFGREPVVPLNIPELTAEWRRRRLDEAAGSRSGEARGEFLSPESGGRSA